MNNFTNSIDFKFSPVATFSYSGKPKYAAGKLEYDDNGNAHFACNSYSYCNYCELWSWLLDNFDDEYFYRNVTISFYGKNTRTVKIGRSHINVSAEDKIDIAGECFLPDLMLALYLINTYDVLRPYGFNKTYTFRNKTNTEIADYFEIKFAAYAGTFKLPCDDESTKNRFTSQWSEYKALIQDILSEQFKSKILKADSCMFIQREIEELPGPLAYIDQYSDFINDAIREFNNNDDFCRAEANDPMSHYTLTINDGIYYCKVNNKTIRLKFDDKRHYMVLKSDIQEFIPDAINCVSFYSGYNGATVDKNSEWVTFTSLQKSVETHAMCDFEGSYVEYYCSIDVFLHYITSNRAFKRWYL